MIAAGCGGTTQTAAGIPESASLAPADALLYATVTTDEGSDQWERAERLLERIPEAREGLADAVTSALTDEGLTWDADVGPALGPEVVVVVTQSRRPVVLTQPDSDTALEALLAKGDRKLVTEDVSGWSAVAERAADLTAYRAALERGTLLDVDAFAEGFDSLPEEGLARVWVDARLSMTSARRSKRPPRSGPRARVARGGRLRGGRRPARHDGDPGAGRRGHALRAGALPPRPLPTRSPLSRSGARRRSSSASRAGWTWTGCPNGSSS